MEREEVEKMIAEELEEKDPKEDSKLVCHKCGAKEENIATTKKVLAWIRENDLMSEVPEKDFKAYLENDYVCMECDEVW